MGSIVGISEIVLWAHDGPATVKFYQDVLDLTIISPPERTNPIFLKAGDGRAGIPQMIVVVQLPADAPAFASPRTLHHLAFEISPADFDAERARLTALGFMLRSGQHPIIASRTMYLNDPEGNEVELICRA
ncbi:MAG TPA: VOC family protein [Chloroflexota bacterium]|nr:VOC family protein [Chloroflexota bacterium]